MSREHIVISFDPPHAAKKGLYCLCGWQGRHSFVKVGMSNKHAVYRAFDQKRVCPFLEVAWVAFIGSLHVQKLEKEMHRRLSRKFRQVTKEWFSAKQQIYEMLQDVDAEFCLAADQRHISQWKNRKLFPISRGPRRPRGTWVCPPEVTANLPDLRFVPHPLVKARQIEAVLAESFRVDTAPPQV